MKTNMMNRTSEATLLRVFGKILASAGTGAAVSTLAIACGGATVEPGGGGTNPTYTSLCGAGAPRSFLQGMRATPALDGAVSRTESAFLPTNPTGGPQVTPPPPGAEGDYWKATNGDTVGTLCKTAKDQAACTAKVQNYRVLPADQASCVARYPHAAYSSDGCDLSYILYTRGEEIGVARDTNETLALIGQIDTVEEALWVASTQGYSMSCGFSGAPDSEFRTTDDGGYDLKLVKQANCSPGESDKLHVDYKGTLTVVETEQLTQPPCAVAGRRPDGMQVGTIARSGHGPVGEYFASMAILESGAVIAFRRLEKELIRAGAPAKLLGRVRVAIKDEIRHARKTTALAMKHGVTPGAPTCPPIGEHRTLLEIALENAREGCVRETYGALVAHLQAEEASDPDVRACMQEIATEETQHAALSWDVASFLESQLTADEQAQVISERRAAVRELAMELQVPGNQEVRDVAGIPAPEVATYMLARLEPFLLVA
jgi:hypothetical protein